MRQAFYLIFVVFTLLASSCKDNVICPAFQSTYILNDSIRYAKFSLFGADSLPKYAVASRRNKYGINKKTSLFRKNYELKTSPKVNVLGPPRKDSLLTVDEGEFLASDFSSTDSLGVDSPGADSVNQVPRSVVSSNEEPTGPQYKYRYDRALPYNHEQEYYNKYFGELFIDKRPKPEVTNLDILTDLQEVDSITSAKPVRKGLKGLFKKKKRNEEAEVEEDLELGEEVVEEEEEGEG